MKFLSINNVTNCVECVYIGVETLVILVEGFSEIVGTENGEDEHDHGMMMMMTSTNRTFVRVEVYGSTPVPAES